MPPRRMSRYTFSEAAVDDAGDLLLSEPEPFVFIDRPDNITHVALDGDTWWGLAGFYYQSIPRPAGLWWVLCDFQPEPVLDPTIAITPGTTLYIPSVRTVLEDVFSEKRRAETTG